MNAPATQNIAERRSTLVSDGAASVRERDPNIDYASLEAQALMVIRQSIVAKADSEHKSLSPQVVDNMLAVAKGRLSGLSASELRGIGSSGSLAKDITDFSYTASPLTILQAKAALAAEASGNNVGGDAHRAHEAYLARMEAMRAARMGSGGRFGELDGGSERLSQDDMKNMAAARSLASSLGMPWAANNPELLRLGPSAIQTLHDAGVRRESFERITSKEVGFKAKTAVEIAAFAKAHHLTPEQTNELFDKISAGAKIVSNGDPAVQKELNDATSRFVTGPNTPEARAALEEAWNKHATTPQQKEAAKATTQALEKAAEQTAAKVAVADTKAAVAEDKAKTATTNVAVSEDLKKKEKVVVANSASNAL